MKSYIQLLQEQLHEAEILIKKAESNLLNAPKGTLRITHNKGKIQYYHSVLDSSSVKKHNYISKKDTGLATALAQKDYDLRVLEAARKQKKTIRSFLEGYNYSSIKSTYDNLIPERRQLVTPYTISDKDYIVSWLSKQPANNTFHTEGLKYLTERGEMVRSKSEVIIADKLFSLNIPYKYECPLTLSSGITIHPDFTVLIVSTREEKYWEHLGMMDNDEYIANALLKIEQYERSGILPGTNLILTHETSDRPLDISVLNKIIGTLY